MPGHWTRAERLEACVSINCERSMVRDEPVYLVAGIANQPVCQHCASTRFEKTPPADLPLLAPVIQRDRVMVSDSLEPTARYVSSNWGSVGTKASGELRRMRRRLTDINASDGKLKQLGADR